MSEVGKIGRDFDELRAIFDIVGSGGVPDFIAADRGVLYVFDLSRVAGGGWESDQAPGDPFMAHQALGASVANHNRWNLRNPSDSQKLVILEMISHQTSTAQQLSLSIRDTTAYADFANAMTENCRNFGLNLVASAIATWEQAATPGANVWDLRTSAANVKNEHVFGGRILIPPGASARFVGEVANTTGTVTIYWRERSLR